MLQQEEMSNTIGTKVGIIYSIYLICYKMSNTIGTIVGHVSISDLNRHVTTGRDV